MRAFYYENNSNIRIDETNYRNNYHLVGRLNLDPGEYAIWAKLNVGANVASGYPPPAWPYNAGMAALAYADATDVAYVGIKPANAENHTIVSLMTVAKSDRQRSVRLYYLSLYPLPVFVNGMRITALEVDIAEHQIITFGERDVVPADVEEERRDAILKAKYTDAALRWIPDDDR